MSIYNKNIMKRALLLILTMFIWSIGFSQSDNCAGATNLTVGASCSNTAYSVTNSFNNNGPDPSCGGTNEDDGWYTFTANGPSTIIEASVSNGDDLVITVFTGGCGSLSEFSCTNSSGLSQTETASLTTVNGTQYWVMLVSTGNSAFSGNICIYTPSSSNNDCSGATILCSNASFTGNSSGSGTQELTVTNSGCMSVEHQSSWYTFTINTSGTLDFVISPNNGTDDDGFALCGPNPNCTPTSTPLRCSWAAGGGNTGLANGSGDNTEGAAGDRFVEDVNVIAGETYILVVDNFSSTTSPFNISFGGSAVLECLTLPLELIEFSGYNNDDYNRIDWTSLSEINNNYFLLERNVEGLSWVGIANIEGSGNSNSVNHYSFDDYTYLNSRNFYRLTQVDFDGNYEIFNVITIDNSITTKTLIKVVNIMGQEVKTNHKGLVIEMYTDGTTRKIFR